MRKKTLLIFLVILIILAAPVVFFVLTTAISSPKPVIIVAPKTTAAKENTSYVNNLAIVMNQKGKLTFTCLDQDQNKRSIVIGASDKKQIEDRLQQAINWAGDSQKLNVLIQDSKETHYNTFQTVIKTLKTKGIYKYKLISTNKDNEH